MHKIRDAPNKVSRQACYQVVIPREERDRIGLKPHSKVAVEARGDHIVISRIDDEIRGIGCALRDGTDATDYVRQLRNEWGNRPA